MSKQNLVSRSPEETEQLGIKLGHLLQPGSVICLQGDLGAGKTAFVRGLAFGWGAIEKASSPTFTVINQYHHPDSQTIFFHGDCYRLDSIEDAWSAGLEDIFTSNAIVALEWPNKIRELLPDDVLWIFFEWLDETTRRVTFDAVGKDSQSLLEALF
jgi:tRNA threonylcarbamoyladenosine biosynthesis protein TsaE